MVPILVTPLVLRSLSVEEYGRFTLILSYGTILSHIISLGLSQYILRELPEKGFINLKDSVETIFNVIITLSILGILVGYMLKWWPLIIAGLSAIDGFYKYFNRAEDNHVRYRNQSLIYIFSYIILIVIFSKQLTLFLLILCYSLSILFSIIYTALNTPLKIVPNTYISWHRIKPALIYGLPLMIATSLQYALRMLDVWLTSSLGIFLVGMLSVYKKLLLPTVMVGMLFNLVVPYYVYKSTVSREKIHLIVNLSRLIMTMYVATVYIGLEKVMIFFGTEELSQFSQLIFPLYILNIISFMSGQVDMWLNKARETRYIPGFIFLSFLLMLIGYFFLIKEPTITKILSIICNSLFFVYVLKYIFCLRVGIRLGFNNIEIVYSVILFFLFYFVFILDIVQSIYALGIFFFIDIYALLNGLIINRSGSNE